MQQITLACLLLVFVGTAHAQNFNIKIDEKSPDPFVLATKEPKKAWDPRVKPNFDALVVDPRLKSSKRKKRSKK